MTKTVSVAIDGPSGAGKSSLSKRLAADFKFVYVDTGAIYRTVALYMLNNHVDLENSGAVVSRLNEIEIDLQYAEDGLQHMYLCGEDVTSDIRLPEVSLAASVVSAIPDVRAFLLNMQREMADRFNVIMDGRDIGTVVLPNATVKIYLTASLQARALRRYKELLEKGIDTDLDVVLEEMRQRDENDTNREIAPLRPAEDSVIADTSELDFDESFELLKSIIKEKIGYGKR